MIIHLEQHIHLDDLDNLYKILHQFQIQYTDVTTQEAKYLVCILKQPIDIRIIGNLNGVKDVFKVNDSYKLVSNQWKTTRTNINLGDNVKISHQDFTLMAGPCSIESESQVDKISDFLVQQGVKIMRGGVFKPRSSPYAFRGLGLDGLKMYSAICRDKGLKIITEVMQSSDIDAMLPYVDILQVGARNAQNFNLLDALGKIDKPVLLKRGISGTIEELLQSAEYIFSKGNEKIILCERGIRTFENAYRNTFDINAIAILKDKSHLPVIADTSHGIGIRKYVPAITLAAMAAGADGAIVEIHHQPEIAFSDGAQTMNFQEFEHLQHKLTHLKHVL